VAAIAVTALLRLGSTGTKSDWIPIYQDVLKTSFQALAIGALGGLARLIFDRRKTRDAVVAEERKAMDTAATKLRDLRYGYITTLVDVSHDIDTAKLIIRANRSVKSWTDMVNGRIVPARSRLGDMMHQLDNWTKAGLPVFDQTRSFTQELQGMDTYLKALLDEYAEKKQGLGELQLKAELAKATDLEARKQLLDRIWETMSGLPLLGDFVEHGPEYSNYHHNYLAALLEMRQSLVPRTPRRPPRAGSSAQGVVTPS